MNHSLSLNRISQSDQAQPNRFALGVEQSGDTSFADVFSLIDVSITSSSVNETPAVEDASLADGYEPQSQSNSTSETERSDEAEANEGLEVEALAEPAVPIDSALIEALPEEQVAENSDTVRLDAGTEPETETTAESDVAPDTQQVDPATEAAPESQDVEAAAEIGLQDVPSEDVLKQGAGVSDGEGADAAESEAANTARKVESAVQSSNQAEAEIGPAADANTQSGSDDEQQLVDSDVVDLEVEATGEEQPEHESSGRRRSAVKSDMVGMNSHQRDGADETLVSSEQVRQAQGTHKADVAVAADETATAPPIELPDAEIPSAVESSSVLKELGPQLAAPQTKATGEVAKIPGADNSIGKSAPAVGEIGGVKAKESASQVTGGKTAPAEPSADIDSVERARLMQRVTRAFQQLGRDGGSVKIRLHPPRLGSVGIEVGVDGQKMRARIVTETDAARSVLRDAVPELRQRLSDQGVHLESIDIQTQAEAGQGGNEFQDSPFANDSRERRNLPARESAVKDRLQATVAADPAGTITESAIDIVG